MPAQSPEQCDELFAKFAQARDLDSLVGLYEEHASLVNEDRSVAVGTKAIRQTLQGMFAAMPEISLTMNVHQVIRGGDDLAVLHNDWTANGKTADGSPISMSHKALEVVRRQADGTWRFAIDDPYGRG
jgi:uncharacterized protein (TIGR02246 family)